MTANYGLMTSTCTPRVYTVANCLYHSDYTVCAVCASGYFLSADKKTCSPIAGSAYTAITNCELYAPPAAGAITCALCKDTFALTGDGLHCISNCLVIGTTGCSQCAQSYYYDAATFQCTSTSSTNCAYFLGSTTACSGCLPNYYLLNQQCKTLAEIGNVCIADTSSALPAACLVCEEGYQYNPTTNTCDTLSTPLPTGCAYGNPTGQCIICLDTHYWNGSACVAVPAADPTCLCYGGRSYFWPTTV